MTKVWGIEEKEFFVLVEELNRFNKNKRVFATQVFLKDSVWYALVYYDDYSDGGKTDFANKSSNSTSNSPVTFKPATDKQKNLLKKLGFKGDVSKLSKSEAFKLLNENLPKKK